MRQTNGERIFSVFNYFLMAFLCFVMLYPLWHVAMSSISDPTRLFVERGIRLLPVGDLTLKGYELVFQNPNVAVGFMNTAYYVAVRTILSMIITVMAAYVLSRKGPYWNSAISKFIIFTMYFQGGLIPFFLMVRAMGLMNNRWAIILPVLVSTWNLIIMRTAFAGIPESLIESAKIDGASDFRIVWTIVVPVAQATVAVIALFYAVTMWNTWFNPSIFLTDRALWPMQLILREILLEHTAVVSAQSGVAGVTEQPMYRLLLQYSTIMVATVPILLIYPFLQKYFISGVMIGSIKG